MSPGKKQHAKRVREVWAVNSCNSNSTTVKSEAVECGKGDDIKASLSSVTMENGSCSNDAVERLTTNGGGDGSSSNDSVKQSVTTTTADSNCGSSTTSGQDRLVAASDNDDKTSLGVPVVVATSETTTSAVKKEKECDDDGGSSVDAKDNVSRKPDQEEEEDPVDSLRRRTGLILRDPAAVRRRWVEPVLEEENYQPDQARVFNPDS